jgi:hypothetical protein
MKLLFVLTARKKKYHADYAEIPFDIEPTPEAKNATVQSQGSHYLG